MKTTRTLLSLVLWVLLSASCAEGPKPVVNTQEKLLGNWYLLSAQNFITKFAFISLHSNGYCYYSSSPLLNEQSNLCFWSFNKNNTFRIYSNHTDDNYNFTMEFAVNDDLILTQGASVCVYRRFQSEQQLETPYRAMGTWQLVETTNATLQQFAFLEIEYSGTGTACDANHQPLATFKWQSALTSVSLTFGQQADLLSLKLTFDSSGRLQLQTPDGNTVAYYSRWL